MARLESDFPDLVCVTFSNAVSWSTVVKHDIVFMLRPANPEQLEAAQLVKSTRTPLWVDHDDDLTSVPSDNAWADHVRAPAVQYAFREIMRLADFVTVSTAPLQAKMANLCGAPSKVGLIPNAWDFERLGGTEIVKKDYAPKNIISWRGGPSHSRDILHFADDLKLIIKRDVDHRMLFMGSAPTYMLESDEFTLRDRIHTIPVIKSPFRYLEVLRSMRPKIHVIPLVDDALNRSKSAIAAIESVMAGAVPVVPRELQPFNPLLLAAPSFSIKEKGSLAAAVDELLHEPEQLRRMRVASLETIIRREWNLKQTNKSRLAVAWKLAGRDPAEVLK